MSTFTGLVWHAARHRAGTSVCIPITYHLLSWRSEHSQAGPHTLQSIWLSNQIQRWALILLTVLHDVEWFIWKEIISSAHSMCHIEDLLLTSMTIQPSMLMTIRAVNFICPYLILGTHCQRLSRLFNRVFCDMVLCSPVDIYQCSGGNLPSWSSGKKSW